MDMNLPYALMQSPDRIVGRPSSDGMDFPFSPQLKVNFVKEQRAMWSRWTPEPRPCFNPQLLRDIRAYYEFLSQTHGQVYDGVDDHPLEYVVLASGVPGVFNMGGDLDLFKQLIETRDRAGMLTYGRACIDVLYRNYLGHDLPLTTISLVQGECLGGGFEAALSSDIVIAEKSSRFGFPEILFNLFPGMGAYSFLDRRVGQKLTEELLTSGKIYSAEEMLTLGVIDVVAEDGQGEAEVAALIRRRSRNRNGLAALAAVRRRVHSIDFEELLHVVEIWVDSALRLNPRDLKLMHRLVNKQNHLGDSQQVH
jgi:DSF synthase